MCAPGAHAPPAPLRAPPLQAVDLSSLTEHRLEEIRTFFCDSEWFGEDRAEPMVGEYGNVDVAKRYVVQSCGWVTAARQPGSPAAQQPSSPAAQQPSSPAAQQPSSPAAAWAWVRR
jgi:hypothetical protein